MKGTNIFVTFRGLFDFPITIDNTTLGKSALWPAISDCPDAHNCRRCGKCDALMDELSHRSGRIGESAVAQTLAGRAVPRS